MTVKICGGTWSMITALAAFLLLGCTGGLATAAPVTKSPDRGPYWEPIGYSETKVYADSFIAPNSGYVDDLGTWLNAWEGPSDIKFQVYGSIGGNPASGPDISNVYATTSILSGLAPSGLAYYDFAPIPGGKPLIGGNTYWFGISAIDAASGGAYQVGGHTQNSGGIIDNGTFWYSNNPPAFNLGGTPEMAFSVSVAVPEPSTLVLLGGGTLGLAVCVWCRRKATAST
jgi:hypothetical protein